MKLTRIALAWILGIAAANWLNVPLPFGLSLFLLSLAIVLLYFRDKPVRRLALVMAAFCAGMLRVNVSWPHHDLMPLSAYNDQGTLVLHGTISSDPEIRDRNSRFRVEVHQTQWQDHLVEVHGSVQVYAPRYPYYLYGDAITLTGRLKSPTASSDFDYGAYLARQGIGSVMYDPQIALDEAATRPSLQRWLYGLRRRAREVVARIMPEPEASLLMGILLGWESSIAPEIMDAFVATGTIHLLVISGFNLALLAGLFVRGATGWIHRYTAHLLALALILLYTLFVGAGTPVVRAAIMASMGLFAYLAGRPYQVADGLALAVLLMTAGNPFLLWDVSFQLSVMATVGLFVLLPRLDGYVRQWLQRGLDTSLSLRWGQILSELLLASLAAQLTTLPLILYHFGELSWVSLVTNALVMPVQPLIMVGGGIATLVGAVSAPLGQVVAWVPWLFLTYMAHVVRWTASWPGALQTVQLEGWMLAAYYSVLFGLPWLLTHRREWGDRLRALAISLAQPASKRSPRGVWVGMAILATVGVLEWVAVLALPDGKLHLHMLDVGQGDAILITLPAGQQILVDGGPDPSKLLAALGQEMPFWDRELDLIVLTHGDMDHLGGLIPVLERYQVGLVLETGCMEDTATTRQWDALLAERAYPTLAARQGLVIHWGDPTWLRLEALHPSALFLSTQPSENNESIVLQLDYGEMRFLFTGDIEVEAEQALLRAGVLTNCQVLKVSHHGAAQASTSALLRVVQPQVALISVGQGNPNGHPTQATLDRLLASGARVLRTDRVGAIELITDGAELWWATER